MRPKRRSTAGIARRRARQKYRPDDRARACCRETAGTGARIRVSFDRTARCRQRFPLPREPRADTTAGFRPADKAPCRAGADPATPGNDPEKQWFRLLPRIPPQPLPSPSSVVPNQRTTTDSAFYRLVTHFFFTRLPCHAESLALPISVESVKFSFAPAVIRGFRFRIGSTQFA